MLISLHAFYSVALSADYTTDRDECHFCFIDVICLSLFSENVPKWNVFPSTLWLVGCLFPLRDSMSLFSRVVSSPVRCFDAAYLRAPVSWVHSKVRFLIRSYLSASRFATCAEYEISVTDCSIPSPQVVQASWQFGTIFSHSCRCAFKCVLCTLRLVCLKPVSRHNREKSKGSCPFDDCDTHHRLDFL